MNIKLLSDCPDYAPILSFWAYMEWYRKRSIEFNLVLKSYKRKATNNILPITWVAIKEGIPVGMITLKENDLWSRKDLNPWLSSLYVIPEFRNQGIGEILIDTLVKKSFELGYNILFLFTVYSKEYYIDHYYTRKGWKFLDNVIDNDGKDSKVYFFINSS